MSAMTDVLHGAIDLHVHSGPSPFPRCFDHVEAARDAHERLGMRALLIKSHHHNTVMDLLAMQDRLASIPTRVFGGIALNNQVGGVNPFAVEMSLRMGGKAVWLPTISAARHMKAAPEDGTFPTSTVALRRAPVAVLDIQGDLLPETVEVLQLVAETGTLLCGGHLDPDAIELVFREAAARGVERLLLNHPNFVLDAEPEQVQRVVEIGAYVEHEVSMYDPEGAKKWDPGILAGWIETVGAERTVLASDLGQAGRPLPVDAFLRVGDLLRALGIPEEDLRRMCCDNPAYLLGLEEAR